MTKDELRNVLDLHGKWLCWEKVGVRANLQGAILRGADLREAGLQDADLEGANLQGAILRDADLREADLRFANLRGANLQGADLREAGLRFADLREADLRGAYLQGAYLQGADLREAGLRFANLRGAYLQGADLRDADLQGAKVSDDHTWGTFMAALPDFLAGGGRPLAEVVTREHLTCHSWVNCPTAAAYGAKGMDDVPEDRKEYARLFIRLFDSFTISPEQIAEACGIALDEVTS